MTPMSFSSFITRVGLWSETKHEGYICIYEELASSCRTTVTFNYTATRSGFYNENLIIAV